MFIDGRSVPNGESIDTDVCIIGTGPAGMTLGLELADRPLRVCLLESGGFELLPEITELSEGQTTGHPYRRLDTSRERCFGGTSQHWHGWCRPLDAIDFEERSWVPYSGWPFGKDHLQPYYAKAHEVVGLGPLRFDAGSWKHPDGAQPLSLAPDLVRTEVYQYAVERLRFGRFYYSRFERSRNLHVYLFSNVVELLGRPDSARVSEIAVKTLEGGSFRVRAKLFVLAVGGIENARLLLASRSKTNVGLGNENDLVGRFFMEHPHARDPGFWVPTSPDVDISYYASQFTVDGVLLRGVLVLARELAIRERRIGFSATVHRLTDTIDDDLLAGSILRTAADIDGNWTEGPAGGSEMPAYRCFCRTEQIPNPNSRVTLVDEKDGLGLPRVRLHWELTEQDVFNIREGLKVIGSALGRAGLGRLHLPPEDFGAEWVERVFGGPHHMGTTRMSTDPKQGVVDANCKLHTVDNVYVAGSSIFPTGGSANPTLTIVAMAARLADHIKERMR